MGENNMDKTKLRATHGPAQAKGVYQGLSIEKVLELAQREVDALASLIKADRSTPAREETASRLIELGLALRDAR